jgi:hypothetical protein
LKAEPKIPGSFYTQFRASPPNAANTVNFTLFDIARQDA